MINIIIFLACFGFWYIYYGLELFINGAHKISLKTMIMTYIPEEILWIIEGPKKGYPGILHFFFTHIFLLFILPLTIILIKG